MSTRRLSAVAIDGCHRWLPSMVAIDGCHRWLNDGHVYTRPFFSSEIGEGARGGGEAEACSLKLAATM